MARTEAGQMRWRFRFERRATDVNGDRLGAWGDGAVTLAARMLSLRGTEAVQSERLQGRQPIVLTIYNCAASRAITSDWRAVDARTGDVYGIKGASPNQDDPMSLIDVLAQAEGTTGG